MKKKIIMALLVLSLATGCGKVPQLKNGDDAVVSIKEGGISATELYNQIKDKYALGTLIDMIDRAILLKEYPNNEDEAKKAANNELENIKKYYVDDNKKYDENALLQALNQYYGVNTIKEFLEILKLGFYREKAIDDYATKSITEKMIKNYYEKEIVGDISCKHILISSKATDKMTEEEKEKAEKEALNKAKDVIKRLKKGEKFDDLAKELSDDASNKDKGGDLGYFNKGKMVTEFENAAFSLKLNKYTTEPVKTKFGYHIILKTGEKEKATLDSTKETIKTTLANDLKTNDKSTSINALVELRKKYDVKINDSEMNKQYSTYISNQLLQANSK